MTQSVGLNLCNRDHFTDHLVPVCVLHDAPLLFTDQEKSDKANRRYPNLNAQALDWGAFTLDDLAEKYKLFITSELWANEKLPKGVRHLHCPHGFSDKRFWLREAAHEDIVLIYGQHMLDMFEQEGVLENLHEYRVVGNLRYEYWKNHRDHLDKVVQDEVFSQFRKQQQTLIYAPTWKDKESSTSYFDVADQILADLPDDLNLILKLHPHLEEDDIAAFYYIQAKHEEKPNVLFLTEFTLIYPLLARCDLYLGDFSSVGYDFLAFDRPLFFFNLQRRTPPYLFQCGIEIGPDDVNKLFSIIEQNQDPKPLSKIRKKIYSYTFEKI